MKSGDMSIGLPKNSPYKSFMNNVLNTLFENGQIKRVMEKWEIKEPSCEPLLVTGEALSLKKLIFIFLIICIGCLLSSFILVCELCRPKQKFDDDEDLELLRFEKIMSEINKNLSEKIWPNVGLLTLLQDASEKIKTD